MTQVTLGSEKKKKKKKFTGVHASDPPRSLRLRRSFWKTVSIYPRSAPDYTTTMHHHHISIVSLLLLPLIFIVSLLLMHVLFPAAVIVKVPVHFFRRANRA